MSKVKLLLKKICLEILSHTLKNKLTINHLRIIGSNNYQTEKAGYHARFII